RGMGRRGTVSPGNQSLADSSSGPVVGEPFAGEPFAGASVAGEPLAGKSVAGQPFVGNRLSGNWSPENRSREGRGRIGRRRFGKLVGGLWVGRPRDYGPTSATRRAPACNAPATTSETVATRRRRERAFRFNGDDNCGFSRRFVRRGVGSSAGLADHGRRHRGGGGGWVHLWLCGLAGDGHPPAFLCLVQPAVPAEPGRSGGRGLRSQEAQAAQRRSEEHTSELQSRAKLVC